MADIELILGVQNEHGESTQNFRNELANIIAQLKGDAKLVLDVSSTGVDKLKADLDGIRTTIDSLSGRTIDIGVNANISGNIDEITAKIKESAKQAAVQATAATSTVGKFTIPFSGKNKASADLSIGNVKEELTDLGASNSIIEAITKGLEEQDLTITKVNGTWTKFTQELDEVDDKGKKIKQTLDALKVSVTGKNSQDEAYTWTSLYDVKGDLLKTNVGANYSWSSSSTKSAKETTEAVKEATQATSAYEAQLRSLRKTQSSIDSVFSSLDKMSGLSDSEKSDLANLKLEYQTVTKEVLDFETAQKEASQQDFSKLSAGLSDIASKAANFKENISSYQNQIDVLKKYSVEASSYLYAAENSLGGNITDEQKQKIAAIRQEIKDTIDTASINIQKSGSILDQDKWASTLASVKAVKDEAKNLGAELTGGSTLTKDESSKLSELKKLATEIDSLRVKEGLYKNEGKENSETAIVEAERLRTLENRYEVLKSELGKTASSKKEYIALSTEEARRTEEVTYAVNKKTAALNDAKNSASKYSVVVKALRDVEKGLGYTAASGTTWYTGLEKAKVTLEGMRDDMSTFDQTTFDNVSASVKDYILQINKAGLAHKGLGDQIQANVKKFASWFSASEMFLTAWRYLKQMVNVVIDLDAAMTELRKVTDETDATYRQFLEDAVSRTKELGASLTDVVNATADFARLGYGVEEASALADTAIVYKNVGDGISDISEASESIISTMQAFGVEVDNAMTIVDKFNEVGNNYAISSSGVGEALLNSASAMAAANNSLDETIALITAANTVVQDPEKVGTALKTVSMYLRAAKTEAEDAGESTDGMAESVSELRDELLALTGQKVDIMDGDTFKSTYQIIKDLSSVWQELSDVSQANILELIGGLRKPRRTEMCA